MIFATSDIHGYPLDSFLRLLDYVRSAPLYMEVSVPMKRFVLVHGGLGGFAPEKGLDEYGTDDLVWTRPEWEERYWDDRMMILGHTPTQFLGGERGRMLVTDTWADIDTGAAGGAARCCSGWTTCIPSTRNKYGIRKRNPGSWRCPDCFGQAGFSWRE